MHDVVRWNERALEKALKTRRIVVISGARQCGKSTLLEMYFKGKAEVRSLDSKQLRDAALLDPQSFIRNDTDCPMVIDEIGRLITSRRFSPVTSAMTSISAANGPSGNC